MEVFHGSKELLLIRSTLRTYTDAFHPAAVVLLLCPLTRGRGVGTQRTAPSVGVRKEKGVEAYRGQGSAPRVVKAFKGPFSGRLAGRVCVGEANRFFSSRAVRLSERVYPGSRGALPMGWRQGRPQQTQLLQRVTDGWASDLRRRSRRVFVPLS